jgi:lipopolysaccharide biosynthesis glycosyltransferase
MKIIYASDDKYFRYVYISIMSLLKNNLDNNNIELVFIEQNVRENNIRLLYLLVKQYKRDIKIIEFKMPEEFNKLPSVGNSKTTFAKFLFSSIFKDDLVAFFDPDTLVLRDLSWLDEVNMDGYMFAGIIENLPKYHRQLVKMDKNSPYINGGMVLCNLSLWRQNNFEAQVFSYIKNNPCDYNYDQGIINELCSGKIKVLPPKYNALSEIFELKLISKIVKRYGFKNYYSQEEIDEAITNPVIVHFTPFLYGKPLVKDCRHPYRNIFLKYLDESPLDKELEDKSCNKKIKIRRWVLHNMPFSFYCAFEKVLDIRRYIHMKKHG